jgi:RNA processing factor Prp31
MYFFKKAEYRESLSEYLKNRMNAIAPNLTIMLGELVGARLISHAGSLINLAKYLYIKKISCINSLNFRS